MDMKIKENYYKVSEWIQLRTDLDLFEKNILAIVTTFGSTRLTNPQLQVILSCEESTITRRIKSLVEKGLIEVKKKQSGKRILFSIPSNRLPNSVCETVNTVCETTPSGITSYIEKKVLSSPTVESVSDGDLEKETQPVSDGAPGEIEITSQVKTRFKNSKSFRIYLNEYQYYYKNFINFFQIDPEEKFSQHQEKYLNWMLDKFIESRKKKNSKKELLQQKSS